MHFNIHGQFVKDEGYLIGLTRDMKPRWTLVMDNMPLALRLKNASPETNVVHRTYRDNGFWSRQNPKAWIDYHAGLPERGSIWHYTDNEVGVRPHWHMELMAQSLELSTPLKAILCNTSTGSPDWFEWMNDKAAKQMLEMAAANREHFVLGLHEYFMGVATTGLQGMIAETDVSKWPAARNSDLNDFHIGRWRRVGNIPGLRILISETGTDDLQDLHSRFMKIEGGWERAEPHWRKWYPALSTSEAFYMNLWYAWHIAYSNSQVEDALLYCFGSNPASRGKHDDWTKFDVESLRELHRLMAAWNIPKGLERMAPYVNPPTPPPVKPIEPLPPKPDFKIGGSFTLDVTNIPEGVNLRLNPNTSSIVIKLMTGVVGRVKVVGVEGDWLGIQLPDYIGWFNHAIKGIAFRNYLPPQPPPPNPPDPTETSATVTVKIVNADLDPDLAAAVRKFFEGSKVSIEIKPNG